MLIKHTLLKDFLIKKKTTKLMNFISRSLISYGFSNVLVFRTWWYTSFSLPFVFQLIKYMQRCGNEVLMRRASRMSIEATTIEFALSLFFLSTNLMVNRDKKKKRKRCELSVFLLYLFIHVHYLFSMRMHLFKSIYAHTHTHIK
jgi:hypothetical protein